MMNKSCENKDRDGSWALRLRGDAGGQQQCLVVRYRHHLANLSPPAPLPNCAKQVAPNTELESHLSGVRSFPFLFACGRNTWRYVRNGSYVA